MGHIRATARLLELLGNLFLRPLLAAVVTITAIGSAVPPWALASCVCDDVDSRCCCGESEPTSSGCCCSSGCCSSGRAAARCGVKQSSGKLRSSTCGCCDRQNSVAETASCAQPGSCCESGTCCCSRPAEPLAPAPQHSSVRPISVADSGAVPPASVPDVRAPVGARREATNPLLRGAYASISAQSLLCVWTL